MHQTVNSGGVREVLWRAFVLYNKFLWCVKSEPKSIKNKTKQNLQWFLFDVRIKFQVQDVALAYLSHFSHLPSLQPSGIISILLVPCFLCPWDIHIYTPSVWNTQHPEDSFDPPISQSPFRSQLTHPFFCKASLRPESWIQPPLMPSHGKHPILLRCPAFHTVQSLSPFACDSRKSDHVVHLTLSSS